MVQELIRQLLQHGQADAVAVEQLMKERAMIEELATASHVLTGEPSMIEKAGAILFTCHEAEALLPSYVEAWQAGEELAGTYAKLHRHLRTCTRCAQQVRELYQLLQQETTVAPTYRTFAEAKEREQSRTTLWQQGATQLAHFVETVAIGIEGTKARFETLAVGLRPQLAPATAMRSSAAEEMIEVLELPHPERDFVIRLRMGALRDGLGALALQFATLSQETLLADIKVTLRDNDGSLLESTRSDQDGIALFEALEPGKYQLQIERADQQWLVGISIK